MVPLPKIDFNMLAASTEVEELSQNRSGRAVRLLVRTGTLLVAVVAGLLTVTVAPAQAVDRCDGWGEEHSPAVIVLCLYDDWSATGFELSSSIRVGRSATTATGCKVTVYAALRRPGHPEWRTSKQTRDCTWSLQLRDNWASYEHGSSGTSATQIDVRGCIDLYYRGSDKSGWQRCVDTGWHSTR